MNPQPANHIRRAARFVLRVGERLYRKHGLILASALAFDLLLSIVPLLALTLIALSRLLGDTRVRELIGSQLDRLLPGAIDPVLGAYATFVEESGSIGVVGVLSLAVFAVMAFRTLKEAMDIVFGPPAVPRPAWRAVLIPVAYLPVFGAGLLAVTGLMTAADTLPLGAVRWLGIDPGSLLPTALRAGGFLGLVSLFASFYRFLPANTPPWSLAAVGGVLAGSLWELTRSVLTWYFSHLSMVGVVYGSLASVIILLISFDFAALVVLFAGQVVAEKMGHPSA